ncbi:MAG TPA: bifunctional demethylmenaquinone methyltransferase/2-methoxy-6-polyprenyl-1,4-benzoquinol methylase UbiE [Phycisphaerales bacterium]|nr:bifunctional demethylmenaquinone methyltransferase/2-methoxy-6-polyprenyl-1,4-benzoquinol methylase UbiE [Phycisphaerales bacterium]
MKDASSGWSDAELRADPHAHAAKAEKVRGMFGAIAKSYDLNNRLHSLGMDQSWRRAAVRLAAPKPSDRVLDVACGTGDLSRAFADAYAAYIVGLDFTPEMLEIAKRHRRTPRDAHPVDPPRIEYVQGDAMQLPFEDGSFEIVSIAFGIRNVSDPHKALREFRRVLRPGGRLVVLEFDRPKSKLIAKLNDWYCNVVMPRTATLISGDRSGAYKYLPRSVRTFMSGEQMREAMAGAGFVNAASTALTFGVCACHRGEVGA